MIGLDERSVPRLVENIDLDLDNTLILGLGLGEV